VTDLLMFAVFPYVAVVLLLVVSIQRYRRNAYTVSSLSSQFLESKGLFWGSVPFHFGILTLFVGHLVGLLIPRQVAIWNGSPLRLLVLEMSALVAGLLTLFGTLRLMWRRMRSPRLMQVTSPMDRLLYALLLFQIGSGLWIALGCRWGTAWYVHTAVPYLRSLFILQPDLKPITGIPLVVRLHMLGAFVLLALFSFTRLVHVLVAPIPYLWRRVQLVVWNRRRPARAVSTGTRAARGA
jgi:nitrate reductase gamma subunit